MKGRGTRTIPDSNLQMVTETAKTKTHFVIVDAVGAIQSKKTDSRPLERKQGIPLKNLLGAVTMGVGEEDLFLSLANRLIRLDRQITANQEKMILAKTGGKNLKQITKELISAFDEDSIEKMKLEKPTLAPLFVWQAFTALEKSDAKEPKNELISFVSLVRHVCGIDGKLKPFDAMIDKNFQT